MDWFDLEHQYKLYLERMGINESEMLPNEQIERKMAFYCGAYQVLATLKEVVPKMKEIEAAEKLEDMFNQAKEFFTKQSNKNNPNIN